MRLDGYSRERLNWLSLSSGIVAAERGGRLVVPRDGPVAAGLLRRGGDWKSVSAKSRARTKCRSGRSTLGSARLRRRSSDNKSTLAKSGCRLRPLTSWLRTWRAASASSGTQSSAIKPGLAGDRLVQAQGDAEEPAVNEATRSTSWASAFVLGVLLVEANTGEGLK